MSSFTARNVTGGVLVLVALWIAAPAAAGQELGLPLFGSHADVTGDVTLTSDRMTAWFRFLDESKDTLEGDFRLTAPSVRVTSFEYRGYVTTSLAGQPLIEAEPTAVKQTAEFSGHVDLRPMRLDRDAQVRFVPGPHAPAAAHASTGWRIYPDPDQADGWDGAGSSHVWLSEWELKPFVAAPRDHLLSIGQETEFTSQGAFSLWVHGADLQVTDGSGTRLLEGRSVGTSHAVGPVSAESAIWTDFLIEVQSDADLSLTWAGQSNVFTATAQVQGDGTMTVHDARHTAPGSEPPDGEAENVVFEGRIEGTLSHIGQGSQGYLSWAPRVPAGVQGASQPSPFPNVPPGLGEWLGLLLVALLVGFGSAALLRHRRTPRAAPSTEEGRAARTQPEPTASIPDMERAVRRNPRDAQARYTLGVALAGVNRLGDAMKHLEFAVRKDAAFLGLLVSDPDTQAFRHDPRIALFVRRAARRFQDSAHRGYV